MANYRNPRHRSAGRAFQLQSEQLEMRYLLAADNPLHNLADPTDVNADGYVSAIDALHVIQRLNQQSNGERSFAAHSIPNTFVDVNNDTFVSAMDALLVIHQLNQNSELPGPEPQQAPPEATGDQYTTAKGTPLVVSAADGVLDNDVDDDGDDLFAQVVVDVEHGELEFAVDGSFTYTPESDFAGDDSFSYVAIANAEFSPPVVVTITVEEPNRQPIAVDDSYTTLINQELEVPAAEGVLENDIDEDGDELSVQVIGSGVQNGSLDLKADGSFTYLPNMGFTGEDAFRYLIDDGEALSLSARVVIDVQAENATPVAVADEYSTSEDKPLDVNADEGLLDNDTDGDGDDLEVSIVDEMMNGVAQVSGDGSFSFFPDEDFHGVASFSYVVTDGIAISEPATVTINISPVEDVPKTQADTYSVSEDAILDVPVGEGVLENDFDPEGVALIAVLESDPENGELTFNVDGTFAYVPNQDFFGSDTFSYTAVAGDQVSPLTVVTLEVENVNDAPVASLDAYEVAAGGALEVDELSGLLRNDSDADADMLEVAVWETPANGTLAMSLDGSFLYTPDQGFSGVDTFNYQAGDGIELSNVVTVRISVNAEDATVRFALTPVDASGTPLTSIPVGAGFFLQVTTQDVRPDPSGVFQAVLDGYYDETRVVVTGDPVFSEEFQEAGRFDLGTLGVIGETGAISSSLSETGGGEFVVFNLPMQASRTGIAVFAGDHAETSPENDVLLYGTFDRQPPEVLIFSPGEVEIFEGSTPTAEDDFYDAEEDETLTVSAEDGVLANDSNPDGGSLEAQIASPAQNGLVTLNSDGSFEYVPDANFNGLDTFTYVAVAEGVSSNIATVFITVEAVDDLPIARDDSYDVPGNILVVSAEDGVLSNDSDRDGDEMEAVLENDVEHGSLTLNSDGSFVYTPEINFVGTDTFQYRAVTTAGASNVATVTLNVDDPTPSSIAGFVYTDVNNDGIRSGQEAPIAGVVITLAGTTASGDEVFRTTATASDGSYGFANVTRGSYVVRETQPILMIDGKDTLSGQESQVNDSIVIELPPGTNVTGANFGEWGLKPDFAGNWALIATDPQELVAALDGEGAQQWWSSRFGWNQFDSVQLSFNENRTVLKITVTDRSGDTSSSTISAVGDTRIQFLGETSEGTLVRLLGSPQDFGLSPGLSVLGVDAVFAGN